VSIYNVPVIAIVGRPNVGKSTLFNRLTQSRSALVADEPGVTRDRQYSEIHIEGRRFLLIDTGGFMEESEDPLAPLLVAQVLQAIKEADYLLFVVDGRVGLQSDDYAIANQLRRSNKPVTVIVNKIENETGEIAASEFYQLGWPTVQAISAQHGRGIKALGATLSQYFSEQPEPDTLPAETPGIKIAVMGRPNVGKSTLVNRLLGEDRVIVYDSPGTTRDSIYIPFQRKGKDYILIDTAGIRRRARVQDFVEKISIVKSIQAAHQADVVIFLIDAKSNVNEQDMRLLQLILEVGTPLILAINKWDIANKEEREFLNQTIDRRLEFVDFAPRYFISAARGTGIQSLYKAVHMLYEAVHQDISTGQLTRVLEKAVADHEPPLVKGRRIRLRYAHLTNRHPLTILVHGKQTKSLPDSYVRYLSHCFRKAFCLSGIPIHIKLKTDLNPYNN
jgi:GTP-binding protein